MSEQTSSPGTLRRGLQSGSISFAIALLILAIGSTLLAIRLGDDSDGASLLTDWTTAAQQQGTYRFSMTQSVSGAEAPPGFDSLFSLTGAVDLSKELARTETSIGLLGVNTKCVYIAKGSETIFVGVHPSRVAEFGAKWLRSTTSAALAGVGSFLRPDELDDDPERYFGELERSGSADVKGIATTRYSSEFDLTALYGAGAIASPLPTSIGETIPVDVYIDDDGLVRRITLKINSTEDLSIGFTIDFFDYGKPNGVKEPPPADIKDSGAGDVATACFPKTFGASE
jgi:hypothetical protein